MSAGASVRTPWTTHVLLVEPDPTVRDVLSRAMDPSISVEACADLPTARLQLLATSCDVLVTNLRLGEYNGLHLVYLIRATGLLTRSVVYSDRADLFLAREAQRAGAFYESQVRLLDALPAYLQTPLPSLDRRDPEYPVRRSAFRSGRRRSDVPLPAASAPPGL
jgi:DNA-binding NtrC family response regulator